MSSINFDEWEVIIGLETHVQLKTRSKLFSSAPNRFGDEPNHNICAVDTALPGSLPVLNMEAVRLATLFGLAIGAKVEKVSRFDRKNYFYPDCPRNYQITQSEFPIIRGGSITTLVNGQSMTFSIDRAHLEDDAGTSKHGKECSLIDYNRAGVPLVEIVSTPCMRSADEAVAYGVALKSILEYIDASECNMELGQLRMDVNLSVRKKGETILRNRVEIKNMNSFMFMKMAIEYEKKRQIIAYETEKTRPYDEVIRQSTLRFDTQKGQTYEMRTKENADDYRYFPEPDLLPLVLSDAFIQKCREELPELPLARLHRYVNKLGISEYSANVLVNDKALCNSFESALRHTNNAVGLCNWMTVEFVGRLAGTGITLAESKILPEHIALLVSMIDQGTLNGKIAKAVADEMVANPGTSPEAIVAANPLYRPITDTSSIEAFVDEVLAANPDSIRDYKAGKDKALQFLVGQVMKKSRGQADPEITKNLLINRMNSENAL